MTVVNSEEPCHPNVDADGDGVVDGKEEGVKPQKNKGNPTIVFVIIVALLAWASYHGTRKARSPTSDAPLNWQLHWQKTTSSCDHDDRAEQGIAMVDYDHETSGRSLMPRGCLRSSDSKAFL